VGFKAKEKRMKFEFEVGEEEKHRVEFSHDLFWGRLECHVDGKYIPVEGLQHFGGHVEAVRSFLIGNVEKHEVRIQLIRPLIFAGFRKDWKYKVFVDNNEYKVFEG
jgi:hypothetical protein